MSIQYNLLNLVLDNVLQFSGHFLSPIETGPNKKGQTWSLLHIFLQKSGTSSADVTSATLAR